MSFQRQKLTIWDAALEYIYAELPNDATFFKKANSFKLAKEGFVIKGNTPEGWLPAPFIAFKQHIAGRKLSIKGHTN